MARPNYRGKQITLYAETKEELTEWKQYCHPNTFNSWVRELIQREIEHRSSPVTDNVDELNTLRKRVQELEKDNEAMVIKLKEKEEWENDLLAEHSKDRPLGKEIVDILKLKQPLSSDQITTQIIENQDRVEPGSGKRVFRFGQLAAVNRVLKDFELMELVELTPRGWKLWKK